MTAGLSYRKQQPLASEKPDVADQQVNAKLCSATADKGELETVVERRIQEMLTQEQERIGLKTYSYIYLNSDSRPIEIHYHVTNAESRDGMTSPASFLQLITMNSFVSQPMNQWTRTDRHGDLYCVQLLKGGENGFVSVLTTCGEPGQIGAFDSTSDRIQAMDDLIAEIHRQIQTHRLTAPTERALTAREREVLIWSGNGKTSWEISRILQKSEATINFHLRNAMEKLDCVNRCQAVAKSIALGVITYNDIASAHQQDGGGGSL